MRAIKIQNLDKKFLNTALESNHPNYV